MISRLFTRDVVITKNINKLEEQESSHIANFNDLTQKVTDQSFKISMLENELKSN